VAARKLRHTPIHQSVRRHVLDECNVFTVLWYQLSQLVWRKGSTIDILDMERCEHLHYTATVSQLTPPSTYGSGVWKCQIFDLHAMVNTSTVSDWNLCVGGAVYSQLIESAFYDSGFIRRTTLSTGGPR
jgi:hypothetical protein